MALMKHASDYATLIGPTRATRFTNPYFKRFTAHNPHGVDETTRAHKLNYNNGLFQGTYLLIQRRFGNVCSLSR